MKKPKAEIINKIQEEKKREEEIEKKRQRLRDKQFLERRDVTKLNRINK
jgi:hypothetical protein